MRPTTTLLWQEIFITNEISSKGKGAIKHNSQDQWLRRCTHKSHFTIFLFFISLYICILYYISYTSILILRCIYGYRYVHCCIERHSLTHVRASLFIWLCTCICTNVCSVLYATLNSIHPYVWVSPYHLSKAHPNINVCVHVYIRMYTCILLCVYNDNYVHKSLSNGREWWAHIHWMYKFKWGGLS